MRVDAAKTLPPELRILQLTDLSFVGAARARLLEQLGDAALECVDAAALFTDDLIEIVAVLPAERGLDLELGQPALVLIQLFGLLSRVGVTHVAECSDLGRTPPRTPRTDAQGFLRVFSCPIASLGR